MVGALLDGCTGMWERPVLINEHKLYSDLLHKVYPDLEKLFWPMLISRFWTAKKVTLENCGGHFLQAL